MARRPCKWRKEVSDGLICSTLIHKTSKSQIKVRRSLSLIWHLLATESLTDASSSSTPILHYQSLTRQFQNRSLAGSILWPALLHGWLKICCSGGFCSGRHNKCCSSVSSYLKSVPHTLRQCCYGQSRHSIDHCQRLSGQRIRARMNMIFRKGLRQGGILRRARHYYVRMVRSRAHTFRYEVYLQHELKVVKSLTRQRKRVY